VEKEIDELLAGESESEFEYSDSSENSDNELEDQAVADAIQYEDDDKIAESDETFFFGKIWKTMMAFANGFLNIRGREISL
jgi:hypothetical protein